MFLLRRLVISSSEVSDADSRAVDQDRRWNNAPEKQRDWDNVYEINNEDTNDGEVIHFAMFLFCLHQSIEIENYQQNVDHGIK